MQKVTVAFVFDQKKVQDANLGIVKIRVTHQREKRFITTGIKTSIADWQRLDRMRGELDNRIKDDNFIALHRSLYGYRDGKRGRVEGWLDKAHNVVDQLGPNFTYDAFKSGLATYGRKEPSQAQNEDVIRALLTKQEAMEGQDRVGTASLYGLVAKSILRFIAQLSDKERRHFDLIIQPKRVAYEQPTGLLFKHVTVDFLTKYEAWMLREGKASQRPGGPAEPASSTTVGIYCRHLRAVFNLAKDKGFISDKEYPFGRNRFVIPAGRTPKKALSTADLEKIKTFQPEPDSSEQRAHNLWLFTYYGNGLNMADLCRLRWRDVDQTANYFFFVRQKTKRTRKGDSNPIRVMLRPETWAIIERAGTVRRDSNSYLFPFLNDSETEKQAKDKIAQVVKQTNKWMNRLGKKLFIDSDLGTYTARHSFATTLLRNGAPSHLIGTQIGHSQSRSTEHYLGDFEDQDIKAFLNTL